MGKRNRTQNTLPTLYFVTTSIIKWEALFSTPVILDALEDQLFSMFPSYADVLFAYVLMPSHVHFLVGCKQGGQQLSKFMGSFKSLTARKLFPNRGSIWMHRFDDLVIVSQKQFGIKLNYIHENPVRKELVTNAVEWKWSSAKFWLFDETHETLRKIWSIEK